MRVILLPARARSGAHAGGRRDDVPVQIKCCIKELSHKMGSGAAPGCLWWLGSLQGRGCQYDSIHHVDTSTHEKFSPLWTGNQGKNGVTANLSLNIDYTIDSIWFLQLLKSYRCIYRCLEWCAMGLKNSIRPSSILFLSGGYYLFKGAWWFIARL